MKIFGSILTSSCHALAAGALAWLTIDFAAASLTFHDGKGTLLAGMAGLFALAAVMQTVCLYRSLPK